MIPPSDMILITLNARGATPIVREFSPPCFQDAMALSDQEMTYYLRDLGNRPEENGTMQLVDRC